MNEETTAKASTQAGPQAEPETRPTEPKPSEPGQDVGWVGVSPSQVARTVAIALLTAVVVFGALFLLWQVRTFIGWFVVALFLAVALDPAVNWLQRRHRLVKRPLAIVLAYLGVIAVLLFMVGIFLPLLVDQINGLVDFVAAAAQAPEGPTEYIKGLAQNTGLVGYSRGSATKSRVSGTNSESWSGTSSPPQEQSPSAQPDSSLRWRPY